MLRAVKILEIRFPTNGEGEGKFKKFQIRNPPPPCDIPFSRSYTDKINNVHKIFKIIQNILGLGNPLRFRLNL